MSTRTVCFQCGHAISELPKLNRLPNGENCPACVERAYDSVPAALPKENESISFEERTRQPELFPEADEPA